MISRIIKVVVEVTETLIILDITKTESNSCFIIHWTKKQFISKRVKVYKLASNIKRANNLQLDDVSDADFENSLYAFG